MDAGIALATVGGFFVGGVVGAIGMAVLAASSAMDDGDKLLELEAARQRLAQQLDIVRETARQQQERADTYYQLYCEGAKANAQLRKGK